MSVLVNGLPQIVDYDNFTEYYSQYYDCIKEYLQNEKYDKAMKVVGKISYKMFYWGRKEDIIDLLNTFPIASLDEYTRNEILYYRLFSYLFIFSEKETGTWNDVFRKINESSDINFNQLIRFRNLEGIFSRLFSKDIEKAISIHKEAIEVIIGYNGITNSLKTLLSLNYQNLALCYYEMRKTKEADEFLALAEKALKENPNCEPYKFARLYFYRAQLKYEAEADDMQWVPYIKILSEDYLDKYFFPDIERLLNNFLGRIELKEKNINNYFAFKQNALNCDFCLYHEYFIADFLDIAKQIKKYKTDYKEELINGLNPIIALLELYELEDEKLFLNHISSYLKGETINADSKISNESLERLLNETIR